VSEEVPRANGAGASFAVGEAVVCPHHGVGTVVDQGMRTLGTTRSEYLTIEVERHQIKLLVPAEGRARARLRPLASRAHALRALEALSAPPQAVAENWRQRQKDAQSALASGKLLLVAELVRDLAHAAQARSLATTDHGIYEKARGLLEDELRAALEMSASTTATAVDRQLPAGGVRPRG
jgi:RNA polymerase-interacting CarD/CdnL/TRCF family regulator